MQNPTTIPLSPRPFTSAPENSRETEAPTDNEEGGYYNDDLDGEKNYNNEPTAQPNTEVITPATTANDGSDSDVSGGGKFGIVLLAGIVFGVIVIGYVTMQRRLRQTYRGSYSSTNGMMNSAETELGLWESDSRNHRNDDDGLL